MTLQYSAVIIAEHYHHDFLVKILILLYSYHRFVVIFCLQYWWTSEISSVTCDLISPWQPRKAVPGLRRLVAGLSPRRPRFAPVNPRGFCVGQSGTAIGLLRVLRSSTSVHRHCPWSYSIWGINSSPDSGCSSETQSHPVDMNNMNKQSQLTNMMRTHEDFDQSLLYSSSVRMMMAEHSCLQ
jgi:hypothetical protein